LAIRRGTQSNVRLDTCTDLRASISNPIKNSWRGGRPWLSSVADRACGDINRVESRSGGREIRAFAAAKKRLAGKGWSLRRKPYVTVAVSARVTAKPPYRYVHEKVLLFGSDPEGLVKVRLRARPRQRSLVAGGWSQKHPGVDDELRSRLEKVASSEEATNRTHRGPHFAVGFGGVQQFLGSKVMVGCISNRLRGGHQARRTANGRRGTRRAVARAAYNAVGPPQQVSTSRRRRLKLGKPRRRHHRPGRGR